jgi:hypothetical protein
MNASIARLSLALGLLCGGYASGETLLINDQVVVASTEVAHPERGSTMATVEARFGAPQTRHEAVGSPPITRWDYAGFSVFFEKDRVIHAVVVGN